MATLPAKLDDLLATLTDGERAGYKLIMSLAASKLSPRFTDDRSISTEDAYSVVSKALIKLHTYGKPITDTGIAWAGRPDFMSDDLLERLQAEAREIRKAASNYEDHLIGAGGSHATELANSSELLHLVANAAGPVRSTGVASFIFYDQEGQGIRPHVDTDIFSLNVLIMLDHESPSPKRSRLVLFPPDKPEHPVELKPGELVIFYAGGVMHGREPLSLGEKVWILTLGFQPLQEN